MLPKHACTASSHSQIRIYDDEDGARKEEIAQLRRLGSFATGGLEPDLTLVFDADPAKLLARRQQRGVQDRYEQQGLEFQQRLRAGFLQLAEAEPQRRATNDEQELRAESSTSITGRWSGKEDV